MHLAARGGGGTGEGGKVSPPALYLGVGAKLGSVGSRAQIALLAHRLGSWAPRLESGGEAPSGIAMGIAVALYVFLFVPRGN